MFQGAMAGKVALVTLGLYSGADGQDVGGKSLVHDPSFIERLNSVPGTTWVAGPSDFFDAMTFDDARPMLGAALYPEDPHPPLEDSAYISIQDGDMPEAFDATTHWAGLLHPIRNQLRCGSCWAFSASEVLSDRFAIATNKSSPVLSPEDMVSCDSGDMGCSGGILKNAWNYLTTTGIVTDSCFPYAAGSGEAPSCEQTCANSESWTKYKASTAYTISGPANMQKEIMTNGPIQVAFMVYKSFMSYKSGVYKKHFFEYLPEGGHAVKIVGWGVEAGTDYWLVANSWGPSWGIEGYFKIARGTNHCGIEESGPPYAGLPELGAPSLVV